MIQLKQAAATVEPKQGKKRQSQDLLNIEQRCFYCFSKSSYTSWFKYNALKSW